MKRLEDRIGVAVVDISGGGSLEERLERKVDLSYAAGLWLTSCPCRILDTIQ